MRAGLYIAAALLLGAIVAELLLADPGYMALRFAGYLIEMSAVTFALLLVASYFVVRLLVHVYNGRRLWRAAQLERRRERARRSLSQGILELAEGRFDSAENTVMRFVRDSEYPVAHYLLASRAAESQGATQRRDEWLARALDLPSENQAPVLITQAEYLLKHKQLSAALAALEQLEARHEQTPRGLLLLARIYRQTGDWEKLQELEPRLRATKGVDIALADDTVAQIYLDRLKAAGAQKDAGALRAAWKDMPNSLGKRSDIVVAYARAAQACGDADAAEKELCELLAEQWDEAAVTVYGEIETTEPLRTLDRLEGWLTAHREDAALLLASARQAIRAELYGKARTFLETSIAIRPRLDAYQLLANLLEQLGERDRALRVLHDALAFATGSRAKLPTIRQRRWLARR
jgi:HemY protein